MNSPLAERLDSWLGKTLFIPIIIRLCQSFGCTQYRFSRVCWFIALLVAFGVAPDLIGKIVLGVFAVIMCVVAAFANHTPVPSWRWFRLLMAAFLVYELCRQRIDREVYDTFVLFAEYAALIRTIPPLEAKKRGQRRAVARAVAP